MADRSTLTIHKLDEFKEWLDLVGVEHRPTTADWQVLQVRLPNDPRWHAIYQKASAKKHLSVTGPLVRLVREFVERPLPMHRRHADVRPGLMQVPRISMNRCCEKAVPLGVAVCPECAEASAAYQGDTRAIDSPPWD